MQNKEKQLALFGAGNVGNKALSYYSLGKVAFFIDNKLAGHYKMNVPVISLADFLKLNTTEYQVIVTVSYNYFAEVSDQLIEKGITDFFWFDECCKLEYKSNPRIAMLKNIHKGKRCFFVGNGPSLSPNDLDKIYDNGDISFGFNLISSIYPKTKWRPNYVATADILALKNIFANLNPGQVALLGCDGDSFGCKLPNLDNVVVLNVIYRTATKGEGREITISYPGKLEYPQFSFECENCLYGADTPYVFLQMAVYMGFSEIYLLGFDRTSVKKNELGVRTVFTKENSKIFKAIHFEGYLDKVKSEYECYMPASAEGISFYSADIAYKFAEKVSSSNGFKIFNATRGGYLECFERVDFDSLFGENE